MSWGSMSCHWFFFKVGGRRRYFNVVFYSNQLHLYTGRIFPFPFSHQIKVFGFRFLCVVCSQSRPGIRVACEPASHLFGIPALEASHMPHSVWPPPLSLKMLTLSSIYNLSVALAMSLTLELLHLLMQPALRLPKDDSCPAFLFAEGLLGGGAGRLTEPSWDKV